MSFTFDDSAQPYRAYLFVNGWMMGKRVANLGSVADLRTCTCIDVDILFIQPTVQIPCPSRHLRLRWEEVGYADICNCNQADHVFWISTVAIALWAMEPNVTISPTLELTVDGVLEGGVGGIEVNNPVWSSQGREWGGGKLRVPWVTPINLCFAAWAGIFISKLLMLPITVVCRIMNFFHCAKSEWAAFLETHYSTFPPI